MGAGAIGMGLLVGSVAYPGMFLLTAALTVTALLPARRERAGVPRRSGQITVLSADGGGLRVHGDVLGGGG